MLRRVARPYKVSIRRTLADATAATTKKAILQLVRFDPTTNSSRVESYEYDKHHDYMVLDLITAVKAHQDPSLAFRASCCEGVCGSCAMNINGINSLACITFAQPVTTVGPLPNFPVIKDFVVDLRAFFRQYASIRPFVRNTNLSRYRVENVMERYKRLMTALHGGLPPMTQEEEDLGKEKPQNEVMALLEMADALCEAGNTNHLIGVLRRLERVGLRFNNAAVKKLLLQTLDNHKKRIGN